MIFRNYRKYINITAFVLCFWFFFVSCDIEDIARLFERMRDTNPNLQIAACLPNFDSKRNNPTQDSDPLYNQQWHLDNTGQRAFATNPGSAGVDLNLPMGLSGEGVTVNVIDDGVEWTHEDLANNIITSDSKHFVNLQGECIIENMDGASHGTSVAGIIAAEQDNGLGGRGVAPKAKIISHNYLAVQTNGVFMASLTASADIINQSFGSENITDMLIGSRNVDVYRSVVNDLRSGKGAIVIKSVGNGFLRLGGIDCSDYFQISTVDTMPKAAITCQNANMDTSNTLPYIIVVAAVNAQGIKASYSTAGSAILVSGFGGEFGKEYPALITTDLTGCNRGTSSTIGSFTRRITDTSSDGNSSSDVNCNYTIFNGTSAAAPTVAGVVALMLEVNRDLTWRDVRHILVHTSKRIDVSRDAAVLVSSDNIDIKDATAELGWQTNAVGHEFHNWYGFGLVDASAAVAMAEIHQADSFGDWTFAKVITSIKDTSIPDASSAGLTNQADIDENIIIESVQIKINITHPHTSDLGIFLTSPSGSTSLLLNFANVFRDDDDLEIVLASQAFYGENALGIWEIKVIDYIGENKIATNKLNVGSLNNWELIVYGHTP